MGKTRQTFCSLPINLNLVNRFRDFLISTVMYNIDFPIFDF